jgi:hypothetical protein
MANLRGKRKATAGSPSPGPSKPADTSDIPPAKRSRTTRSVPSASSRPKAKPRATSLLPADLDRLASKVKGNLKRPDLPTEDVKSHLIERGYDVGATMADILVPEGSEIPFLSKDLDDGDVLRVRREESVLISELTDESDDDSLISTSRRSETVPPAGASGSTTVTSSTTVTPSSVRGASIPPGGTIITEAENGLITSTSAGGAEQFSAGFLALPRELRDQIYAELLVYDGAAYIKQPKFNFAVKSIPTFPLAITRVCKQLQEECLDVFYTENNFVSY